MKKIQRLGLVVFSLVLLLSLSTCLDPIAGMPEITFNIRGQLDFSDVTAAAFIVTNLSRTVQVTEITITQPLWVPGVSLPADGPFGSTITGMPGSGERSAAYLSPSDSTYDAVIKYTIDGVEGVLAFPEYNSLRFLLPNPRDAREFFIYRDEDGNISLSHINYFNGQPERSSPILINYNEGDTIDVNNIINNGNDGAGSSPPFILVRDREVISPLIVVNRTMDMDIEMIRFSRGNQSYTIGSLDPALDFSGVRRNSERGIALNNHREWRVDAYIEGRLDPFTITNKYVYASTDTNANNNFVYFYKNIYGEYGFTPVWPPYANDHAADPGTYVPPDKEFDNVAVLVVTNLLDNEAATVSISGGGSGFSTLNLTVGAKTRRATYLPPSVNEYQVQVQVSGTATVTIPVLLHSPRELAEIFIYRSANGSINIGIEINNPSGGTGAEDDPYAGAGTIPAAIPPAGRNHLSMFIINNRTTDMGISKVEFTGTVDDKTETYTVNSVYAAGRQSIALTHGAWSVVLTATDGKTYRGTVFVFHSNDPQAVNENYINFYKTVSGDYAISTIWPAINAADLLPPAQPIEVHPSLNSAVLMLTNLSKSTDVTSISISHANRLDGNVTISDAPLRLQTKALYLPPALDYQLDVTIAGKTVINVPYRFNLPFEKDVLELFIFQNRAGHFVVTDRLGFLRADPFHGDIGNPVMTDPNEGEGSMPAVIPPHNRDKIGTFIIVNQTNSQNIESVTFTQGNRSYTMNGVSTNNSRSIGLGQGDWAVSVTYFNAATNRYITIPSRNAHIVPSNDPWAINHVMYFYRNNRGDYSISWLWPPYPNDVHEEDVLPPDAGFGRGTIKIINNTYNLVTSVLIHNRLVPDRPPMFLDSETAVNNPFYPPVPIQFNQTGFVDVVGTPAFPIDPHGNYLITVLMQTIEGEASLEVLAYIKDRVVVIVIDDDCNCFTGGCYCTGGGCNCSTGGCNCATNQYTVTFDANGATSGTAPAPISVNVGSSLALPTQGNLEKTGNAFIGWNTEPDGSGTHYGAGTSFTPTRDITLYARWVDSALFYIVSFDLNGGSGTNPGPILVPVGESLTLPGQGNITLEDYWFGGWNTKSDGTGDYFYGGSIFTPINDITLYANWFYVPGWRYVPAGPFEMGRELGTDPYLVNPAWWQTDEYGNVTPVHWVTLTRGYYMMATNVTVAMWMDVMKDNPNGIDETIGWFNTSPINLTRPASGGGGYSGVSWYDTLVYANRLSIREGLEPAYRINGTTNPDLWGIVPTTNDNVWNAVQMNLLASGYRLPTEAEWEYAAKGGPHLWDFPYSYSGSNNHDEVAWYSGNAVWGGNSAPVALLKPNKLGIYDMSGNVTEWVWDGNAAYTSSSKVDPTGGMGDIARILRGRGINSTAQGINNVILRGGNQHYTRFGNVTFRLVRTDLNSPQQYAVIFHANNATGGEPPRPQVMNQGSSTAAPDRGTLVRAGFTFGGWNTNTVGTGTNYTYGNFFTPTNNMNLYARWIPE